MNTVYLAYLVSPNNKFEIGVYSSELGARKAVWQLSNERVKLNCHNLDDYGLILPRGIDEYRPRSIIRRPAVRFSLFHGTGEV